MSGKKAVTDPVGLAGCGKEVIIIIFFPQSLEEPLKGSEMIGFEFLNNACPVGRG